MLRKLAPREWCAFKRDFPWRVKANIPRCGMHYYEKSMIQAGWDLGTTCALVKQNDAKHHMRVVFHFRTRRHLIQFIDEFYAISCLADKEIDMHYRRARRAYPN